MGDQLLKDLKYRLESVIDWALDEGLTCDQINDKFAYLLNCARAEEEG